MPATPYISRLQQRIHAVGNPVVVGLDPRFEQLPEPILQATAHIADPVRRAAAAYEVFCCRIIDVVAPLVPAVKPQAAFFEEWGPAGCEALHHVIHYARRAGLLVICDAKRGDIGTTAEAYARAYLAGEDPAAAVWGSDALTVNPYLGIDTLEPFVKVATERGAGIYVLVRTSNPGAGAFQDLACGKPVFAHVADAVERLAIGTAGNLPYGAVGAVVGATYPEELTRLRGQMPHTHFLIPGYGSQGGTSADVAAAFAEDGGGAIINSSRGIIFAIQRREYAGRFSPAEWERAVEAAARDMISDLALHTAAARLNSSYN